MSQASPRNILFAVALTIWVAVVTWLTTATLAGAGLPAPVREISLFGSTGLVVIAATAVIVDQLWRAMRDLHREVARLRDGGIDPEVAGAVRRLGDRQGRPEP